MTRSLQFAIFLIALTGIVSTFTGCNEGPLEEAAESVEEAGEEVADEVDDATDEN